MDFKIEISSNVDEKEWNSEPFSPIVKNGILYGRGASDMKTAIAAFLVSSNKFLNSSKSFNAGERRKTSYP